MKKYNPIIYAFLILLALFLLGRACSLRGKYEKLKLEHAGYKGIAQADHDFLTTIVIQKTKENEALTKQAQSILNNAGQPTPKEIAKDKEITRLHKKLTEYEAAGDLAGALTMAKDEIKQLSEKFSLAEDRHKSDLFNLNAIWQKKFDNQVVISDAWKKQYEDEHTLRLMAEEMNGVLEKQVGRIRLGSNLKTILIGAVVAYVGYDLITKK
jgi:hypothetical protein